MSISAQVYCTDSPSSGLQVVMLTGDNPLTACHVAKELKITNKKILILTQNPDTQWVWQSVGGATKATMETSPTQLVGKYDLCLSGDVSIYVSVQWLIEYILSHSVYLIGRGLPISCQLPTKGCFLLCYRTSRFLREWHPNKRRLWSPRTRLSATSLSCVGMVPTM